MSTIYPAFISYSHADTAWAKWLHKALETYRVPARLVSSLQLTSDRLSPIFRDRDELAAAADLTDTIKTALRESSALIVVCSPHASQSPWVQEEIQYFQSLGRGHRIFALLIDDPAVSFPRALLGAEGDAQQEPLAADARPEGDGRGVAKLKLVAALIGARFDELNQRDAQRRQRRLLGIVALSVCGMLLTSALAIWAVLAQKEATEQRDLASQARNEAEHEASKALAVNRFLRSTFELANPYSGGSKDIRLLDALDKSEENIAREFAKVPEIEAVVRTTVGQTYLSLSELDKAERQVNLAYELQTQHLPQQHVDTSHTIMVLSNLQRDRGNYDLAISLGEQAVAMQEAVLGETTALLAPLENLVSGFTLAGRYDEARVTANRTVALAERLEVSDLELAAAYFASASVEGFAEENQTGQERVLRALELQRSAGAAGTLLAETLNLAGTMALGTNRLDEAEQYLSEAVAIARREFGEYHLLTAVYMENLGNVWQRTNRLPDSLKGLKKILEIRTKVLGPEHEMVGRTLANIGTLYGISGNQDLASSYLQQSLEVFEAALPDNHPLIAQLLSMIAAQEMTSGKLAQAISRLQRSMAIRTEVFGADQWQTAQINEQLGRAHALAGQPCRAAVQLDQALRITTDTFGAEDQRVIAVTAQLSELAEDRTRCAPTGQ